MRLLLGRIAAIEAADGDGWMRLSWTAPQGHEAVVWLLVGTERRGDQARR